MPKQRCVWHATEQLYRRVWRDGLRKSQARQWMRQLGQIIHYPKGGLQDSQAKVAALINQLWEHGLPHGARYLEGAASYLFTDPEQPDDNYSAKPFCTIASLYHLALCLGKRSRVS